MRSIRVLAAGAAALALILSACQAGGAPSPATAPATTAPAKPTTPPAASPAVAASPSAAASPAASPAAASPVAKPAASPAASPSAVATGAKPTVKMGSANFPEQVILGELYSQILDANGFVVTKATADKNKLTKLSDLAPVAKDLTLGGPPECPQRPFCLIGLQQTYGLQFKDFKPLDAGGPLTVAAVDSGEIDVGLLFTTDPNITLKGFVLLDDDKKLQLADNIAPIVRNDILNRGADLKDLAGRVSKALTTADLTDLNKQVGLDRKDAKDVAAAYLRSKQLIR